MLRDWGGSVQGVVLVDDVVRSPAPIDLLPESQRGEREASGARRLQLGLAAAVLVLFALALALPLWQKRDAAIGLMPVLAKAQAEAEATDALAKELERNVADYNFLLAKKHANQPVLAFIEELSRLLPDSTWVQQLDIRPQGKVREVQIAGRDALVVEADRDPRAVDDHAQRRTARLGHPRLAARDGALPDRRRSQAARAARAVARVAGGRHRGGANPRARSTRPGARTSPVARACVRSARPCARNARHVAVHPRRQRHPT